jgi:hypothetical protein
MRVACHGYGAVRLEWKTERQISGPTNVAYASVGADFDLDQTNQSISIKKIEGYMYVRPALAGCTVSASL